MTQIHKMFLNEQKMIYAFKLSKGKLLGFISKSAFAGLIATMPMTLFMLLIHRILPKWQRYALPPELITDELAKRIGVAKHMDKQELVGSALVSHFSYGAAMGSLYGPFASKMALPSPLKGAMFGLVVWIGSYFGLLPALRMSEAAPVQPVERNILMIAAHLVWGTALGVTADFLER